MVALSRRLSGRELQLSALEELCADTRTREVRRVLHGRSSGRAQHADPRAEAKRDRDVVRAFHVALGVGGRDGPDGLVATASTTFDAPYHVARRFASLDHISGGRAGWNIVTTSNPDAALNFGLDEHMEHDERYDRAREFYDIVTGLWDSFAEDAFIRDPESGLFFDPERMHVLDYKGKYLKVRGPLNIARPIQGWPVIVQAGASEAGRQLAAETAEVIFASASSLADGRRFYADVKGRMRKLGRDPDHLKVLPGALVIVGDTVEDARKKRALLDSLVHPDSGLASLSIALGCDASDFALDGPLPGDSGKQCEQVEPRSFCRACPARKADRAPACPDRWQFFRTVIRRNCGDDCRSNGGMARLGRLRRVQRDVPSCARRPRRIRGPGGPGAPTARNFSTRVRGPDLAGKSWASAAREPLLPASARDRRVIALTFAGFAMV